MKYSEIIKPLLVFALGFAVVFTSCDDDDENGGTVEDGVEEVEATVEIADADQVTDALDVAGATNVDGNPPSPTTAAGTPEISNNDINVQTGQEGETNITLNYSGTSVEGAYFQVDGASSYLDIPISTGGRTMEDAVTIAIDLAAAFEPGTFCGEICVYDSENRVSEPVTVCIEVIELGGDGSAFIVGTWTLTGTKDSDDDEITAVGEDDVETDTFQCSDGTSVEVSNVYRIEFATAVFDNKGNVRIDGEEYEKELVWDNSTCDQLVYEEETEIIDMDGVWTYDSEAARLDMILQNNEDNEQEVVSFTVVQTDGGVELTFIDLTPNDGDDNDGTLYFSPN